MALLYFDGFAHGNNARYVGSPSLSFSSSGRLAGGYSAAGNGALRAVTPSSEIITGFGVNMSSINGQRMALISGDSAATTHLSLWSDIGGHINVYRGDLGTLLASSTYLMSVGSWFYLELRCTISDTVGVVELRINGSSTPDISFTGDTRNGGTSTNIDAVQAGGSIATSVADWYVLDRTGSRNNNFLGDVAVRVLVPTGDGDLSQLTGSDGNSVANWQQVDELPPSSSDYNGSPTVGNEDTYAVADLPVSVGVVYGAAVNATILKSDAGAIGAEVVSRLGGTDYSSGPRTLSTSATEYREVYEVSPATSLPWTPGEVNGLQVGMQVTT